MLTDWNIYNLVYFFVIYSFLGWCLEVSYYFKNEHRFVNRGFLNGPFCPIYGSSIVVLVTFLENFKDNIFILFFFSFLLTSIIEYFTGLCLEKLFKAKWWDYSNDPFNIHGRICLLYSILWGIGATFLILVIHPMINSIVLNIPNSIRTPLFYTIIIYFLIDFCITLASLLKIDFLLPSIAFAFNKSNLLTVNKNKALFKLKSFEYVIEKFVSNNRRIIRNFSDKNTKSLGNLVHILKEKIKKGGVSE